jgi:Mg-chelatase subunit ChlD
MINPYERLCAFRNRKVHRKIVSVEDLAAIRKKRAAAREEATRLKVEAERREAEEAKKAEDAANATDIREERRHEVSELVLVLFDSSFMRSRCPSLPSRPKPR